MKAIYCKNESEYQAVWSNLAKMGYLHPNGGQLTCGLCTYEFGRGSRYVNIYDGETKVKFARKFVKSHTNIEICAKEFLKV